MQYIYVLEDTALHLRFLEKEIHNTIVIENLPCKIRLVTSASQDIMNDVNFFINQDCIFFLDIELTQSEFDGVQIATFIRSRTRNATIIFITNHPESALLILTNRIMPLDLIQKNLSVDSLRAKIHQDLISAVQRIQCADQQLTFTIASIIHSVNLSKVIYLTTTPNDPGCLELYCDDESASFRGNLTDFEKKYHTLFRCHKSFLVNPGKISIFDSHQRLITFVDGSSADVSYRKISELRKLLATPH